MRRNATNRQRVYASSGTWVALLGVLATMVAVSPIAPLATRSANAVTTLLPRTTLFSETFDSVAEATLPAGWQVVTDIGATAQWSALTATPGTSPQGIPVDATTGTGRFLGIDDVGAAESNSVATPLINIPATTESFASFSLHSFRQTGGNGATTTNVARIFAIDDVGTVLNGGLPLFEMGDTDLSLANGWRPYNLRLADFAGQAIRLRIDFDGVAAIANHDIGFDDLSVYTVDAPIAETLSGPAALTFFNTVPEDHVQRFHNAITPPGGLNGCTTLAPLEPVTTVTSITVADNNAEIIYDHWEDGFGPANERTQWTTEIWGDGDPTNGYPAGNVADVLNAGSLVLLEQRIDPTTLKTVLDYDGGDRITSTSALVVTRLSWSDVSSTLMAGATEVYDTSYYGNRFVVPVGTNSGVIGSLFEYTTASITASRNNTSVYLNGTLVATLQMGESFLTAGNLADGDVISSTGGTVTVSLLAGDICANYETDWFTLMPTRLWDNEYFTPVSSSATATVPSYVHLYNPTAAPLTINYQLGAAAPTTVSVPAQGTASVATAPDAGARFWTATQPFYAVQSYDTGNSSRDWGYTLLPADQLSPVLQAGYAPGADPSTGFTSNVSPLWVTAVYRGTTVPAPTSVTVCVDWEGDSLPLQANGLGYDMTTTVGVLSSTKLKDPDNDNTGTRVFVCNPADPTDVTLDDWGLAGAWGQESQAPAGSPSIDVGTGILNLPIITLDKTVNRVIDANANGVNDVGDVIEYNIAVTNLTSIFVRANTVKVWDVMPTAYLEYVAGSTKRSGTAPAGSNPTTTIAITDDTVSADATTVFPLDDPDSDFNDGVDDGSTLPITLPGKSEVRYVFQARVTAAPANNVISNLACATDGRYRPCARAGVTLAPLGALGDRVWLDEDGDGIQDPGEDGIGGVTVTLTPPAGVDLGLGAGVAVTTVTDADGGYRFTDLPLGIYAVSIEAPVGMDATGDRDGGLDNVSVVAVQDNGGAPSVVSDVDFGLNWVPPVNTNDNTGVGAIGDRVWSDADGDGMQDPGEAGIAGVDVSLYSDPDGDGVYNTLVATVATDATGHYVFDDLAAGVYVVGVTPPAGTTQTGDPDAVLDNRSAPLVLAPGDVIVTADFGYQPTNANSIGDLVWLDGDRDGVFDAGEPGLSGVSVMLLDSTGAVIATVTTDSTGRYSFPGLPDGTYTVVVTDSAGQLDDFVPTVNPIGDAVLDHRTTVTVSGGVDHTAADFGYGPPDYESTNGGIGDTVYLDRNGNGVLDAGEGIEGVRVELFDESGRLLGVEYTNASGVYAFGDLAAGAYRVDVVESTLPGGLVLSVDPDGGDPGASNVTIAAGEFNAVQDFGYAAIDPASIGGTLWNDSDHDGRLDETGRFSGVTVELFDAVGNLIATTRTDADGNYEFVGLPPGTYSVLVSDVDNVLGGLWHTSSNDPTVDGQSHLQGSSVTVGAGTADTSIDFGFASSQASVGNHVWLDTNGDGNIDSGEQPIGGATVTLTITYPDGTVLAVVTTTLPDGSYSFDNLLFDEDYDGDAGTGIDEPTFTVTVETPLGYRSTHDGTADAGGIAVGTDDNADDPSGEPAFPAEGRDDLTNDFGFAPIPAITIVKSTNGDDADTATGPLVAVGAEVTWTYAVTNAGLAALNDVAVTDDRGVIPVAVLVDGFNTGDIDRDGVLDPGESWTYRATGAATVGQYVNVGTATALDPTGASVTSTDPSHYFGVDARILITKNPANQIVPYGQNATFTLTVTNPGNVALANVDLVDPLCTTLSGPAGDGAPVGVLATDESWVYTCVVEFVRNDFVNTASVAASAVDANGVPISGVERVTSSDEAAVDVPGNISLTKSVSGTPLYVGNGDYRITYAVVVRNLGPQTAYSLTDTLAFGDGVTVLSASATASGGGVVDASFTGVAPTTSLAIDVDLAEGATHTYQIVANAHVAADEITSTSGDCVEQVGESGTGFANAAALSFEEVETRTADVCEPVPTSELRLTKAVTNGPTLNPATGLYTITYLLNVTNVGDGPGFYDLVDQFRFGAGVVVVGTPTMTNEVPGTITTNGLWNGASTTEVASNVAIDGQATHTYQAVVEVNGAVVSSSDAADCDTATGFGGTGLTNSATITSDGETSVATDCRPIPLPEVNVTKVLSEAPNPVRNTDGTYTVRYRIDVVNNGVGAGTYTLTDTFAFGDGVTVVGTPLVTNTAPGTITVNPLPTIATNQLILPAATHRYSVEVVVSIDPAMPPSERDCDVTTSGPGTGLANGVVLVANGSTTSSDACTPVPTPLINVTKSIDPVGGVVLLGDGRYELTYTIEVSNVGNGPGVYDLDDTFQFGSGIVVESQTTSATSANPVGTITVDPSWTGVDPATSLVVDQVIRPGQTDTYVVVVTGDASGVVDPADFDCDPTTGDPGGTGFQNRVDIVVDGVSTGDDACPEPTPVAIELVKTLVTPPSPNAAGTYDLLYQITVRNTGGSGVYDLVDELRFGNGVQIVGTPTISGTTSANAPLTTNALWNGTTATTIVTAMPIAPGAIHTYLVSVEADATDIDNAASGDCDLATGTGGSGFLNAAVVTADGLDVTADDCAPVPASAMVVAKQLVSGPTRNDVSGEYSLTYSIVVRNDGDGPGRYSLSDEFAFGAGIVVTSASVAGPSGVVVDAAWTGVAPSTSVVADQTIGPRSSHVYMISVSANADELVTPAAGDCDTTEPFDAAGFRNVATITVDAVSSDDSDCAPVPDPQVTFSKVGVTAVPTATPGQFALTYRLTISNTGNGPGRYDLSDSLDFASGLTVDSVSTESTLPVRATWDGTTDLLLLDDQAIPAHTVHTVDVVVIATVTPVAPPLTRPCATGVAGDDAGFLNNASLDIAGQTLVDDACFDAPNGELSLTKDVSGGPVDNGDGTFTIRYLLSASNAAGAGPATYTLTDTPTFGSGALVTAATALANDAATPTPLNTWDGSVLSIVTDEPIAAGEVHTYLVALTFTIDAATTPLARDCDAATEGPGTGLANGARLTSPGVTLDADDCVPIPAPTISILKEPMTSTPTVQPDGTWRQNYRIVVTNSPTGGPGRYTLADDTAFGLGATLVSAVMSNDVGVNTSGWSGSGTAATDVALAPGDAHIYMVTVTVEIDPTMVSTERDCAIETAGGASGLLNRATVTVDSTIIRDDACTPVPEVTYAAELVKSVYVGHDAGATCEQSVTEGRETASGPFGTAVTYCFTISNTGLSHVAIDLSDATLGIADLAGFAVLASADGRNAAGVLAPGDSATFFMDDSIAGDLLNTATLTYSPTDADGVALPQVPQTDSDTAVVDETPLITVVKTNDADEDGVYHQTETALGLVTDVAFRAAITNNGVDPVDLVSLIDTPFGAQCAALVGATIAAGETVVCDFVETIDLRTESSATDVFVAVASDESGDTGSGQSASTVAFPYPSIELVKVNSSIADNDGSSDVSLGDGLGYTITVTNAGNTVLHAVRISDALIPVTCARQNEAPFDAVVGDSLDIREAITCVGSHTVSQADVDAGFVQNVATTEGLSPSDEVVEASDDVDVLIARRPSLSLDKTVYIGDDGGALCPGSELVSADLGAPVTYCFTVRNTGNTTLTNVALTDELLDIPVASTAVLAAGDPTSVAPGASVVWYFVDSVGEDILVNTATATADAPTGATVTDTDTAAVDGLIADVSITKQVSDETPTIGQVVTYTLTVTNDGPDPATAIVVTDVLPAGLAYAGAIAGGDNRDDTTAPTLTWTINELSATSVVTLSYDATIKRAVDNGALVAGAYDNVAEITAMHESDPDSDPAADHTVDDDGDSDPFDDDEALAAIAPAAVGLSKSVIDVVELGDGTFQVAYRLTAENLGLTTLHDLVITDDVATQLSAIAPTEFTAIDGTLIASTVWDGATSNVVAPGQSLAAGQIATVDISFVVTPGAELGPHHNTATIDASTPTGNPVHDDSTNGTDPDPNGDADPIEDDPTPVHFTEDPAIELIKEFVGFTDVDRSNTTNRGDTTNYTIDVRNIGTTMLLDVVIDDVMLADLLCLRSGGAMFDHVGGAELAVAETVRCTGSRALTQADVDRGSVLNTAVTNGRSPADTAVTDNDQAPLAIAPVAALDTTKTVYVGHDDGAGCPGTDAAAGRLDTEVTYCVNVRNTGTVTLTGVSFDDPLVGVVDASAPAVLLAGTPSSLAPGASVTWYIESSIVADVTNVATGSGVPPVGDPVTSTDTAAVDALIADLSIAKSVSNLTPALGDIVTFTLTVANAGPDAATAVTVRDVLPVGLAYAGGIAGGDTRTDTGAPTLGWTIDHLDDAATVTLSYQATVTRGTSTGPLLAQDYVNRAEITASDQSDPDSDPSTGAGADDHADVLADDDEASRALLPAQVGLAKAVAGIVNNHDGSYTVTYLLTIENIGLTGLSNLVITDPVIEQFAAIEPSGFVALDGSLIGAEDWNGSATSNVLAGGQELAAGESGTVSIRFTVVPGADFGPHENIASVIGTTDSGSETDDDSTVGTNPDPDDDGDPDEDDPTPVTFGEAPLLGLAKAVNSGPTNRHDQTFDIGYEFTVQNMGDVALSDVQVIDDLTKTFPGIDFDVVSIASASLTVNAAYDGDSDTSMLAGSDTMAVGATAIVSITVRIRPGSATGPFLNTAVATGSSPAGTVVTDTSTDGVVPDADDNDDPTDDDDPTPVGTPKPGSIGDRVWFDIDADGEQDSSEPGLSGVVVTILFAGPDGQLGTADDVTGPSVTTDENGNYRFDDLAPGAYRIVIDPDSIDPALIETAEFDDVLDLSVDVVLGEDQDIDDIDFGFTGQADVSIVKTSNAATVRVGATVTFTFTVTNDGPAAALGVVVTDELPDGLTAVEPADERCTLAAGTFTCVLGTVGVDETVEIDVSAVATAPGAITNVAVVTSDGVDPDPTNNTDDVVITIEQPKDRPALPTTGAAPMTLLLLGAGLVVSGVLMRRRRRSLV